VPGLPHRLLTERLVELQEADLVAGTDGPRPLYSLTPKGHDLRHALADIEAWNHPRAAEAIEVGIRG